MDTVNERRYLFINENVSTGPTFSNRAVILTHRNGIFSRVPLFIRLDVRCTNRFEVIANYDLMISQPQNQYIIVTEEFLASYDPTKDIEINESEQRLIIDFTTKQTQLSRFEQLLRYIFGDITDVILTLSNHTDIINNLHDLKLSSYQFGRICCCLISFKALISPDLPISEIIQFTDEYIQYPLLFLAKLIITIIKACPVDQ